jgi:hypothetical protein
LATNYYLARYFSQQAATATGRPRAIQQSPKQLDILEECWNSDPYPPTGEIILLIRDTRLEAAQVKRGVENRRRKIDANVISRYESPETNAAGRMWRAYKRTPVSIVLTRPASLHVAAVSSMDGFSIEVARG